VAEISSACFLNPCFIRVNPWLKSFFASRAAALDFFQSSAPRGRRRRGVAEVYDRGAVSIRITLRHL
jgi:hypothetical protein